MVGCTLSLVEVSTGILGWKRLTVICVLSRLQARVVAVRSQHSWYLTLLGSSQEGTEARKRRRDLFVPVHMLEELPGLPSNVCIQLTDLSGDCRWARWV
jgi:hypothetical protein